MPQTDKYYLLPYEPVDFDDALETYIRRSVFDHNHGYCVWHIVFHHFPGYKSCWKAIPLFGQVESPDFDTKEDAMKYLDDELIKDGWYLIAEDEVDRFKEKLFLLL